MASNRGLSNQKILDKLFADDVEAGVIPVIGVNAQSDAEEAETDYEATLKRKMKRLTMKTYCNTSVVAWLH